MTPLEKVTAALEAHGNPVRNGSACCPAHDDHTPSLTVGEGAEGRAVIHCHGGCKPDDVVSALGLSMTDLFPPSSTNGLGKNGSGSDPVARYPYTDEKGELLYTVLRFDPKSFAQVPASGRKGRGAMEGVRLVLYRLPKVIEAVSTGREVFICEGEKDCDALERAGKVATCNPMGAGKFDKVPDAEILRDAHLRIVMDKDEEGERHARQVAHILRPVAASLMVLEAETGKDAADHLGAGRTVEDFLVVAGHGDAPSVAEWLDESSESADDTQDIIDDAEEEAASWIFRDLGPALRGEVIQIAPTLLNREDGRSHFYVNQVNGLHGDSGTGKSLIALKAATQEMAKGNHVIWVDAEDPNERTIVTRLRALAIPEADILERFHYISPQTPAGPGAIRRIRAAIDLYHPTMVVLDSVGELFGLEGLDENKDTDVGPWMRKVARAIADAGPAVVLIDHSTKAADNPLHASGSKRKRAAITGAAYLVEVTRPLAKGQDGRLKLTCAKDRHGNYARGEHVASIEVNSYPDDGISIHVYPPSPKEKDPDLGVIVLARAAVKAAKGQTAPVTTNTLVGLMKPKGAATLKRAGCELAASRGFLRASAGPNRSTLYEYVSDWVDTPDV